MGGWGAAAAEEIELWVATGGGFGICVGIEGGAKVSSLAE